MGVNDMKDGFTRDPTTGAIYVSQAGERAGTSTIADGTTNTQLLKVLADGSINVNTTGGASSTVDVTDRAARLLGVVSVSSGVDVADRVARLLGVVSVSGTVDISDRAGRVLGAVTGTFWQATQPVSGTFWQATQPVSLATAPSTPVTGTFWQATQPVSLATAPSTPVTGTFWQATQPVSGTVTSNQGTAAATASAWPAKVSDGTNVAAVKAASTAPVATDPTLVVALSPNSAATAAQPVTGTFWQTTQPVSLASLPALATGANVIGAVTQSGTWTVTATPPTLTKSTQGATGFSVQNLRDAGRVGVTVSGYQVAGTITTETAMSLVRQADGVAATAATSFTVTAGKRLRLQQLSATYKQNAAAVSNLKLALRYASTTPTNASPVIAYLDLESSSATTGTMVGPVFFDFPDGFEIPATFVYSLFNLASAATNLVTVTLIGYEY